MPVLGMGTASSPTPPPELVERSVYDAIELGYRHFDTASVYKSEQPLGRAIARAIEDGLISSRGQLFVTSKLWCTDAHPDSVLPAIKQTLRDAGLEYLDLYLVHWPLRLNGEKTLDFSGKNLVPFDMRGTWEVMEECQRLGLTKAIGVSNFTCKKLNQLLAYSNIKPVVNQVEMHPYWQQATLRRMCAENGIHVSAYSPLGGKGNWWGSSSVIEDEVIKSVAESVGRSPAQVCLRWAFEEGVSVIAKSFDKERMKQNMDIFDWELSEEAKVKISRLPQKRLPLGEPFVCPDGMYKSLDELWDGEI